MINTCLQTGLSRSLCAISEREVSGKPEAAKNDYSEGRTSRRMQIDGPGNRSTDIKEEKIFKNCFCFLSIPACYVVNARFDFTSQQRILSETKEEIINRQQLLEGFSSSKVKKEAF